MLKQFPCRRAAAVLVLLCLAGQAFSARLYVDSRPTNLDATDIRCDILLREIPRQMLIIMAIDELGADVVDATLEQGAKPADQVLLGLERKQNRDGHILHINLFDSDNKVIDSSDIGYEFLAHGLPRLQDMVRNMDEKNHARWLSILGTKLSLKPRTIKFDPALPAPEGIEKYLASIDFQDAFLAARMLHRQIADSGESPARLSALVRAYTNLAEACLDLNSPHADAMFSRAYIYAQKLARLAPNDPISYQTRGYLESVHGLVLDAQADFKHADELAKGSAAPSWASLARSMIAYDTAQLLRKMQGDDAPLASYFVWRQFEHSCLPGLTIRMAKLAQRSNPHSLRVFDSIAWNSSVPTLASSTIEAPKVLSKIIARLAVSPDDQVSAPVRNAAVAATRGDFAATQMRDMLATIAGVPRESDDAHLPWGVYASIVREWNFVQVFSRLFYLDWDTCANPESEVPSLMPYVEGHRYALLISSYNPRRTITAPALLNQIRQIHFADDTAVFDTIHIGHYLQRLGLLVDSPHQTNWSNHCAMLSGKTVYDVAGGLWIFRDQEGPGFDTDRRNNAGLLDELSPDHPTALYWRAMVDPEKLSPRAAKLEAEMLGNPVVAFAMGSLHARLKEYDRAEELLRRASLDAPDSPVYSELAEVSLSRGRDVSGYLATWSRYFQRAENTNQDPALIKQRIANRLMQLSEFSQAIPYAEAGLASNISTAADTFILALTRAGEYEKAEQFVASNGQFGIGGYYRWCRETGRGNLSRVEAAYPTAIPRLIASKQPGQMIDVAMYYWVNSNLDRAVELLTAANAAESDTCAAHLLALVQMEQNQTDQAVQTLLRRAKVPGLDSRTRPYALAAAQMERYLTTPDAKLDLTPMETDLRNSARIATRGNILFFFAKACELRGDKEQAMKWYRQCLDTLSFTFTGRWVAATSLRKLGEEYYK